MLRQPLELTWTAMPRAKLTERDLDILRHVARHRITTRAVLRRWICRTEDATKKVLSALAAPLPPASLTKKERKKHADGFYLQTADLGVGRHRCYHLTRLGVQTLGKSESAAHGLGPQALPMHYAALVHCCLNSKRLRVLLTRDEFHPTLERLRTAVLPSEPVADSRNIAYEPAYYFASEGSRTRLTRIVFDLGAHCAQIADKCHGLAGELRRRSPLLAALADRGAFALCVLTHEDDKRNALHEALSKTPIKNVHVAIDVIPLLADLVNHYGTNAPRP